MQVTDSSKTRRAPVVATRAAGKQTQKARADGRRLKVAYLVSRFPKLTETFVLFEMMAVENSGIDVELYPLQREKTDVVHPEALDFLDRAHFTPLVSWSILRAHLSYLGRRPAAYLATLWTLLRANWGSARYFFGVLAFFPKGVFWARQMETTGVDHIHAHFASHPAAIAYAIHRLTGISYSFTGHGSDLNRDRHMLCEKVDGAAFVVPISQYFRKMIVAQCGAGVADKVRVVYCGVDTQLFQPRSERRTPGEFNIIIVGTLHEVKGHTYLLQACRLLAQRGLNFCCRVVGDGPDLAALQAYVSGAGLTQHVQFLGRRTRSEVVARLKSTDVLVSPSVPSSDGRREGIPVVLMEAMASGVPVVASRISGIPELVVDGETGLLVEPGDVEGLADALQRLHDDDGLWRRLAQNGRQKVVVDFDQSQNAARLAAYFGDGWRA